MPTISVFFGIVIRMYYDDHAPPQFHAYYGNEAAVIDIATLQLREGKLRHVHWHWCWSGHPLTAMNC